MRAGASARQSGRPEHNNRRTRRDGTGRPGRAQGRGYAGKGKGKWSAPVVPLLPPGLRLEHRPVVDDGQGPADDARGAGGDDVDADVDDDGAGLDPAPADEGGAADGGDEDVRGGGERREVVGGGGGVRGRLVADSDGGGAAVAEEHREGRAHGVAVAKDHGGLAGDGEVRAPQELHAPFGCAGYEGREPPAQRQPTRVERVEPVHVLVSAHRLRG